MSRLRDWRVWLGAAVTGVCLWLVLRDVSFADVARDMGRMNLLLLLAISVPANVYSLYVRSLRWRHLTDAIQPIPQGPLFRATAVGFMANNILPLRIGEVVRAVTLAREMKISGAAVMGTVLLERMIDSLFFLAMAAAVLIYYGSRIDGVDTTAAGITLAAAISVPLMAIVLLRLAPEWVVQTLDRILRPLLSTALRERLRGLVRGFAEGLGALRGGTHLFWIGFHSLWLWLGVQLLPFLGGMWAIDLELGPPSQVLAAAYTTLVLVGLAVAIPSMPGFFGPYHAACVLGLSLFGVPKATAVAIGTSIHAVFWLTVTGLGLLVLRMGRTSLGELTQASGDGGQAPPPRNR